MTVHPKFGLLPAGELGLAVLLLGNSPVLGDWEVMLAFPALGTRNWEREGRAPALANLCWLPGFNPELPQSTQDAKGESAARALEELSCVLGRQGMCLRRPRHQGGCVTAPSDNELVPRTGGCVLCPSVRLRGSAAIVNPFSSAFLRVCNYLLLVGKVFSYLQLKLCSSPPSLALGN